MSDDEPPAHSWVSPSEPSSRPESAPPTPGWGPPPPPGWGPPPPPYGWAGPPPQSPWAHLVAPQAPKPGIIPLRPLGVGELLDGAFTTIRRYPAATLGLAAAVMLVIQTIQVVVQYAFVHGIADQSTSNANNSFGAQTSSAGGVVFVIGLIATALLSGMLAAVVAQAVLGRPMSAGSALATIRPLFWRLLGVTLLGGLIEILAGVVLVLPGVVLLIAGATIAGVILLVIGIFAAIAAVIWVQVLLLFSAPVVVFEKQRVRAALRRSYALIRHSWWRTFGIELLAGIIGLTITGIITVPFSLVGGLGSAFSGHPASQFTFAHLLITAIGGFIAGTLVRPFSSGIIALLYVDRRMRAEALDLTLQQAVSSPQA